ncbi:uncharacterized protein BDR25DRAFT_213918 [Lindgomyces ingoldianus]|uniref:Uncharacterized protein n=1 Tax=Lindgomyces ingoldianus TaxID=673940 RepID=A0ACB6R9V4_9PLEO|nr:uncharacterized protein BDR25DRAFT_213918 [Lindgomyces ingoldianus]KAF2475302.1 hypothetical protein BDR25DRAFT_213918 [Lindgomyces ingoldianus]
MVYYGVVSKGCQRCRQRKIKCDQRKPVCLRCEKAKIQCPGFRDLADIMFRDESKRIIRRSRMLHEGAQVKQPSAAVVQEVVPALSTVSAVSASPPPISIPYALSQPINEIAAHFFFAHYSCDEPPLSKEYHTWLMQMYFEDRSMNNIRPAIEAAGMAGISNIFYAPYIAWKAKEQYVRALVATNEALGDPVESIADTTLMTVILLGLFEFINIEDWDHYRSWAAHIEGATALLQLRGPEQFNYELGGQLYMQLRSQILFACTQQGVAAPLALLQISNTYRGSFMEKHRKKNKPSPMGDIYFRLLNLRSGIRSRNISDPKVIRKAAVELDNDLQAWRATLPSSWIYATVDAGNTSPGTYFEKKRHIYSSPWTAQVWNSWRTQRILVNQIMHQNEIHYDAPNNANHPSALSIIRQMSTEICISAPNFIGSPRK